MNHAHEPRDTGSLRGTAHMPCNGPDPSAHRIATLHRALVEFDLASESRRGRRRLAARACGVAACALAVTAVMMVAGPLASPVATTGATGHAPVGTHDPIAPASHRGLPAFVQIITSDLELVQELDAAGSCEGIGRDGDHVFIVPCVASAEDHAGGGRNGQPRHPLGALGLSVSHGSQESGGNSSQTAP